MKIYLISDNIDSQTGLRLAGIDGCVVHTADELRSALDKVLSDKDIGIVLITDKFGRDYPDIVGKAKSEHRVPLFVDIPDRHGSGRSKTFITDYINEAIGLKL